MDLPSVEEHKEDPGNKLLLLLESRERQDRLDREQSKKWRNRVKDHALELAALGIEILVVILIGYEICLAIQQGRQERELFDEQKREFRAEQDQAEKLFDEEKKAFSLQEESQKKSIQLLTDLTNESKRSSNIVVKGEQRRLQELTQKPDLYLYLKGERLTAEKTTTKYLEEVFYSTPIEITLNLFLANFLS